MADRVAESWVALDAGTRRQKWAMDFFGGTARCWRSIRREPRRRGLLLLAVVSLVLMMVIQFIRLTDVRRNVAKWQAPTAASSYLPDLVAGVSISTGAFGCACAGVLWFRPDRVRRVLEARRVRRVDRIESRASMAGGDLDGAVDAILGSRRTWRREVPRVPVKVLRWGLTTTRAGAYLFDASFVGVIVTVQFTIMPLSRAWLGPGGTIWVAWAPLVVILTAVFLAARRPRRLRLRLMAALDKRHCPECGYDLASLESPGVVQGLGPDACPECGVRWPLVPPEFRS